MELLLTWPIAEVVAIRKASAINHRRFLMSFHTRRSIASSGFVVVVMCTFWSAGCGRKKTDDDKSPAPASVQQSVPEPLPEPIVKAWTEAGASTGWFRQISPGNVMFLPKLKPLKAGDVPAFVFHSLPEGILAKLPPPRQPFGLQLGSEGAQVTDASLKGLGRLEHLHTLYLEGSKVTDAGLKELAGLKQLQRLSLSERVTDAGLKELTALKGLQSLRLDFSPKVTDAGVQELQKALPGCKIIK
jgi:hypothetical protein